MANIRLTFTHKNGKFCICATVEGTKIRHYKVIEGLQNPNFAKWDGKAQRFISKSQDDLSNNQFLTRLYSHYQSLIDNNDFANGAELFAYNKQRENVKHYSLSTPREEITLGNWIEKIIEDYKNPSRLKPTSNYQLYKTLLHKLQEEKNLINKPISAINDESFIHLIGWINKRKCKKGKGNNFIGTMKVFRATIEKARKARLTEYRPDFPYMDYAPVTNHISDNAHEVLVNGGTVKSLTIEQYTQFLNMNLKEVPVGGGVHMDYYKELYRDFAILLYELKSRPIDVLKLHWDNIAVDPASKRYVVTYIPAKKKNYGKSARKTKSALVVQFLSDEAVRIIMKYKGKSKGGYIFPFKLNQQKWDLDNPEQYHYHYYKANHIFGSINTFLHRVGGILKVPYQLTLYVFRRTAITHAIIDNKIPLPMLAKTAGTSVAMIEAHYANYLHTLENY